MFAERMRLRKDMAEHDASEQDANFKLTCREHDIEHARILKASKGRTTKVCTCYVTGANPNKRI